MDYDKRLSCLRALVSDADKAVEIGPKLSSISEYYSILQQLETSDSSVSFFPLEHEKHKEFIKSIELILNVTKNMNQNMSVLESASPSRLNSLLQHEEAVYQKNGQILSTLERVLADLSSFSRLPSAHRFQNGEKSV